jgi:Ala-tRNA(Pro) deacylase
MSPTRLHQYLERENAPHEVIHHARTITARATAARANIRDDMLAKTVMVKLDGRMVMAVLPASRRVHLERLRKLTGADRIELATEADFRDRFPDCEIGAMPPFGNLYGMEVFVAEELALDHDIVFNDGTHTDLVRMPYEAFERLVDPILANLSRPDHHE